MTVNGGWRTGVLSYGLILVIGGLVFGLVGVVRMAAAPEGAEPSPEAWVKAYLPPDCACHPLMQTAREPFVRDARPLLVVQCTCVGYLLPQAPSSSPSATATPSVTVVPSPRARQR